MQRSKIKNGDREPSQLRHLQESSMTTYTKKVLLMKAEISGMEQDKDTTLPKFDQIDDLIRNCSRDFA